MFFPDLSSYAYIGVEPSTLTVGWLDTQHPFPCGESSPQFTKRLRSFVLNPVNQTRGFHRCPFCSDPNARGSAEIRVASKSGIQYAAPTLILHYIEAHKYLPPPEFIAAVVGGDDEG